MDDVIAAIATAWGESGISVIRLSGAGAVALVDPFLRGGRLLSDEMPRRMVLRNVVDASSEVVDQVLAVRFEHGASYTGEESVEVHCHGGIAASRRCLELFLSAGARLAMPGEFTKRAFLCGRIDLAQAEAVAGIVRAKSDGSLLSANRSLLGGLSERIRNLMDELTVIRAELEAHLDYPEEVEPGDDRALWARLVETERAIRELNERCRVGLILENGFSAVILGRPNVGKSSLLNALAGEERAIVTNIPGTTRDTVDVSVMHRGLLIRFIDTAGIGEAGDSMEELGMARSLAAMKNADVRVIVLDSSSPFTDEDRAAFMKLTEGSVLDPTSGGRGRPAVVVLNKNDLPGALSLRALANPPGEPSRSVREEEIIQLSALTKDGVSSLKDAIFELALKDATVDGSYAATERTLEALSEAGRCVAEAITTLERSVGMDVTGSLLAEASSSLASLLGADATEELLDAIFSSFCVGK